MKCDYCEALMVEVEDGVWMCPSCPHVVTIPRYFVQ